MYKVFYKINIQKIIIKVSNLQSTQKCQMEEKIKERATLITFLKMQNKNVK